jgi:signal transduction histidine kinase/ligand-binding sensor domain-containing protein
VLRNACHESQVLLQIMMTSRSAVFGVWLLFFAVSPVDALDPSRQITQYGHTAWRTKDGFFSASPSALAQTADGYIWIATQAGLMRFDGVRFTRWTPPDGQRLPSLGITSLLAARDGSLWIGTEVGLCQWANGRLITYAAGQGSIIAIAEEREGATWFLRARSMDPGRLCQVVAASVRCYGEPDGVTEDPASMLKVDASGNLWLGSSRTLLHGRPGHFRAYAPGALASNANQSGVLGLALDEDHGLWVGVGQSGDGLGLQRLVHDTWTPVVTPELDGSTLMVTALFQDRDRALWIGTMNQGLYRVHGGTAHRFQAADGLSGDNVFQCYEDREGTLWVVTSGGIDSFRDLRVTTWSQREGLSSGEIDGIFAARDGTVWIGSANALDAFRDGRVSSLQTGKGLPGNQVTSIFEDRRGLLWVGIDSMLSVYEHGRFRRVDRPDGQPVGMVVGMTEDTDGNLWIEVIGPPRTLIRIRDRIVRDIFPEPAMPAARRVAAAPDGGIWLGLMTGDLARWRDGRLDIIPFRPAGMPSVNGLFNQLVVQPDGTVLGATAFGLIGWQHGTARTLTVRNGLPCDNLYALVPDQEQDLWLYTPCGLFEIPHDTLREWWTNADVIVHPVVLDILDGAQGAFAPFESATRSPDGRLWFANGTQVQMIDPARLRTNAIPPSVHVEEIVADRASYAPRDGLSLPPLTRDLHITYTALSLAVPQKVRFRYKLEGHDVDWVDPGTRRQAFYGDLPPGDYRFRVMASNNDGVWNEGGATLPFRILPAWHETPWVRAASLLAALGLVCVGYRVHVRQIAATLGARFDERLKERTRLARNLHDTLLQTIQASKVTVDTRLLGLTDPVQMRQAAEEVSTWLGQAVREGRTALSSLRTAATAPCGDLAEAMRQATDEIVSRGSMEAACRVVGDVKDVHPIVGEEITAIGREALRNACVHSGGTRVDVELRYEASLTLRVHDNGRGIDPAVAEQGRDGHFGMRGMRERAAGIGATLRIVSTEAGGTTLTLVVPGSVAFSRPSRAARR